MTSEVMTASVKQLKIMFSSVVNEKRPIEKINLYLMRLYDAQNRAVRKSVAKQTRNVLTRLNDI